MEPEFRYEYDDDYDKLDIYVDEVLSAEWGAIVDPDSQLEEFKRVFKLGMNYQKSLENAND